jgi:hypothetical protein
MKSATEVIANVQIVEARLLIISLLCSEYSLTLA